MVIGLYKPKMDNRMRPTDEIYKELQQAYDLFNAKLFSGKLPPCLITLQREKKTYGYFSAERYINLQHVKRDEIAINPAYFAVQTLTGVMQTLVHEMVHTWQHHYGKPGRRRYHNKEWGDQMEAIGLMPSATGKPGGKKTGEKMCDYVIEGGPFSIACTQLFTAKFKLSWFDRQPIRHVNPEILDNASEEETAYMEDLGIVLVDEVQSKPNRVKYTCSKCALNVWGKPDLHVICGDCGKRFKAN